VLAGGVSLHHERCAFLWLVGQPTCAESLAHLHDNSFCGCQWSPCWHHVPSLPSFACSVICFPMLKNLLVLSRSPPHSLSLLLPSSFPLCVPPPPDPHSPAPLCHGWPSAHHFLTHLPSTSIEQRWGFIGANGVEMCSNPSGAHAPSSFRSGCCDYGPPPFSRQLEIPQF
jgi:hypothetical protein